jgi:hypothetical protein
MNKQLGKPSWVCVPKPLAFGCKLRAPSSTSSALATQVSQLVVFAQRLLTNCGPFT